jgi:multicomponent Na+:H+ antiporter subunit D
MVLATIATWVMLFVVKGDKFVVIQFFEGLDISFKLDGFGKIFSGMVSILWPLATLYAFSYMKHAKKKRVYFMFYELTYAVVLGISFASSLVSLYFFYEALTLVTIPLINQPKTREAKRASRFYLYISLFGSTLALVGITLLISVFNTGEFINVFSESTTIYESNKTLAYIAYIALFLGFGVKAAIFPFHLWLPRAGAAPTPTTALLHAVAVVKAGSFAIIRVIYSVIGVSILSGSVVHIISLLIASFTIIFGSAMAAKQVHMKRRFAYSTISNISYILLAATMMNEYGLYAAMLHLIFHSFAKITIFFIAGGLMHNADVIYVDQVDGLAKKMPLTFVSYILAGLSIVGIPMFAGFISKFEIATAGIMVNTWYSYIGIAALLISALLTAIYVIDLIIRAYFKKPNEYNLKNYEKAHEVNYKFLLPIMTFAILSLLLGVFGNSFIELVIELLGGII